MENLTHHLLIATPNIQEDFFEQSVVYINEDNEDGITGLVINKPMPLTISDIAELAELNQEALPNIDQQHVLMGGPSHVKQMFVVTRESIRTDHETQTQNESVDACAVFLGCATWSREQLEKEIYHNDWLIIKADSDILFQTPVFDRWHYALNLMGIKPEQLSESTGRA